MQNTPIFVRKNHEKFGEFTNISYLCKRNTKTWLNTAQENALKSTMLRKIFLTFKYNLIWKTFFGKKKI